METFSLKEPFSSIAFTCRSLSKSSSFAFLGGLGGPEGLGGLGGSLPSRDYWFIGIESKILYHLTERRNVSQMEAIYTPYLSENFHKGRGKGRFGRMANS